MKKRAACMGVALAVALACGNAALRAGQQNMGSRVFLDPFRSPVQPVGKVVKPSIEKLIGTWIMDHEASRFENLQPPAESTRIYKDLGNGTYTFTQITRTVDGRELELTYNSKDTQDVNTVYRLDPDGNRNPTGGTIMFRWVDPFTSEQMEMNPAGITTMTTREISPDGGVMTLTLPSNPFLYVHMHSDDPLPDIVVYRKQS
jgi:hypothetical protein